MTRRSPAAAARAQDKLAATHQRLVAAVDALADDTVWRGLLRLTSRVHRYSPNNLLLIAAQRPDATCVHGYKKWTEFGRQVREGERGIAILAPTVRRRTDAPDTAGDTTAGQRTADGSHRDATEVAGDTEPTGRLVVTGFRVAYVFDISQTDGPDLSTTTPQLLDGEAPLGLFADLVDLIEAAGYSFGYQLLDNGNGRTDYLTREVLIRPDLSGAQMVKTLSHELAHVLLHDPTDNPHVSLRPIEVEAESVAYIVTAAHGLPSDVYSVPYVTGWAGGNHELLESTAARVLSCAATILATTGPEDPLSPAADAGREASRDRTLDTERDAELDEGLDAEVIDLTAVLTSRSVDGVGGVAR